MIFMLDTNTFDFIYDHKLIKILNTLVSDNQVELHVTHVQLDEIEKISDEIKKEKIKTISYTTIVASVGFIGTDEPTSRGYVGSRIDQVEHIKSDEEEIINRVKRTLTTTHPLANTADISIAYTAVKNEADYLVSNDVGIHGILKEFNSSVKSITNPEFHEIIKNML